jgi:acetyltransferase-like isoleucine patch superfamily enzyme
MISSFPSRPKVCDYLLRKTRYAFWCLRMLNQDVSLHPDSNIALTVEIAAGSGSVLIGKHSIIDRGVIIRAHDGSVNIGNLTTIGPYSTLYAGGPLVIGSHVRIGPNVGIFASDHIYHSLDTLIYQQGTRKIGVLIGDDVWIGAGAIIVDGVTISSGCVVGAGSVVTSDLPAYSVAAGVPARVIRRRTD